MEKQEIKDILMSMRTKENDAVVSNLLGRIDFMDEQALEIALERIGDNEESVRDFLKNKLLEKMQNQNEEKYPINDMFTYGISGNCIHLHLPGDLHQMLSKKGISGTIDIVNLQLLDVIDRIKSLKDKGFERFQGKDKNVGTALISFETISSEKWQNKKSQKIQEFVKKGITIEENSQVKALN